MTTLDTPATSAVVPAAPGPDSTAGLGEATSAMSGDAPIVGAAGSSWSVAELVGEVLPARRLPLYLGAAALLAVGVVDPPAAIGAALGYEVLRRWTAAAPPTG